MSSTSKEDLPAKITISTSEINTKEPDYQLKREQLWEAFVDDFVDYPTLENWRWGDNFTARALQDMLRSNDLYVPKERGAKNISKHLENLVNNQSYENPDAREEPMQVPKLTPSQRDKSVVEHDKSYDWQYEDKVKIYDGSGQNCRIQDYENDKNYAQNQSSNYQTRKSQNYGPTQSSSNRQSPMYSHESLHSGPYSQSLFAPYVIHRFSKEISILEKSYPEKLKYRGDGDTFEYKLHIFISRYKQNAVPFQATPSAFSVMLTEMDLSFYYSRLERTPDQTLQNLCNAMKNHLEYFEYRRNQQDTWHALKISDISNLNLSKPLSYSLNLLIERLDEMKFGLPSGLNNDNILHHKIRNACEDHPAFTSVYERVSPTVNSLISDLQTSANKYDRRRLKAKSLTENYITDRHYHFNNGRIQKSQPHTKRRQFIKFPDGCVKLKKDTPAYENAFQQYLLEMEEQNQFVETQEYSEFDLPSDILLKKAGEMSENFNSNEPDTTFDQNFTEILFTKRNSLNGFEEMQTLSNRKVTHILSQYSVPNPIDGEPNAEKIAS
ncbi:hypothetical protein GcM1_218049 [Golovinomyces cichoracearum]|uniref:Integrase and RNaseH domain-containing protein n=1 Tax=Golovinomyces cichoracearum TaxID=62708 RepID=A0A420IST6_9PEZI|nr:hypothetical protein GcM1_218049 [Golovinomyces cichoracearum]